MKIVVVTSASEASKKLLSLVKHCKTLSWATAWATENAVVNAALDAHEKIEHLVVGTHQYFTDPKVLDRGLGIEKFKVMWPNRLLRSTTLRQAS